MGTADSTNYQEALGSSICSDFPIGRLKCSSRRPQVRSPWRIVADTIFPLASLTRTYVDAQQPNTRLLSMRHLHVFTEDIQTRAKLTTWLAISMQFDLHSQQTLLRLHSTRQLNIDFVGMECPTWNTKTFSAQEVSIPQRGCDALKVRGVSTFLEIYFGLGKMCFYDMRGQEDPLMFRTIALDKPGGCSCSPRG